MMDGEHELEKFELRSAAAIWESLTLSQQTLLISEPRCEREYGGGCTVAEADKIISRRPFRWPDSKPEYYDDADGARLLGLGLVRLWNGLSTEGRFYRLTIFGELVARYGRAARCVSLARGAAA